LIFLLQLLIRKVHAQVEASFLVGANEELTKTYASVVLSNAEGVVEYLKSGLLCKAII
jgi:hypothetical protein